MRILFIGDVVARPGRRAVRELLPRLVEGHGLHVVIANGENSAGGAGMTRQTADELFRAGVHLITSGDHLWDQKGVEHLLKDEPRCLRPANYPDGTPGQGEAVYQAPGLAPVGVLNLQGSTFMRALDNPFPCAQAAVERLRETAPVIVVDFHAEATAEKIALGRMLDGKVSLVIGTHTHCQTADEQIFPGGTAFLCDAGFTGPQESVLGRKIDPVIRRFLTYQPQRFDIASEEVYLMGAVVEVDSSTGRAVGIQRVAERVPGTERGKSASA